MDARTLVTAVTVGTAALHSGAAGGALDALVGDAAANRAPALVARSLDAFLAVERAYREARYTDARQELDALWHDAPPGGDGWVEASRATRRLAKSPGLNIGHPPCYYSLRMLTDCVRWRIESGSRVTADSAARRAVLTVVLAGRSAGAEPRTWAELEEGRGVAVEHTLAPELLADDYRVIRQSLWLFREYMLGSTEGKLGVEVRVAHLPDTVVRVHCRAKPSRYAGLAEGAAGVVGRSVGEEVLRGTDWWWFIYPSHVPEQHADFERTEFITGGMGTGPDGASPCFIIDDRWLTRKPPHIGFGPYTEVERRAYLPQWLQHEFMHHLFRIYPGFGLEDEGHQWFDRKTWPEGFEGRFEADYYAEAMHKLLRTPQAKPPMHIALRYAPPPREVLAQVKLEDLVGSYRHRPVQNDWHIGSISVEERDAGGDVAVLRWTNQADASWRLFPGPAAGVLRTGEENPYYKSNPQGERTFRIVLRRDAAGEYRPEPAGFQFQSGFYALEDSSGPDVQYEKRDIEGWTVFVDRRLLGKEDDVGLQVLRLLETKLYEIGRAVPEGGCRQLREVPIWLGVDNGHAPCAEYHPSREWLRKNGYNPDKAQCVEIGCAEKFLLWSKHQPMMVLHELAHAYHHQVIGHGHAALRAAYEKAVASEAYDAVLCHDGKTKRAYAMNNVKEYFAELTECFFGANDFYPFVRAELREHDPEGCRLLRELWSSPPDRARP